MSDTSEEWIRLLFFTNCLFPYCENHGSFVFRRTFKAIISSKGISFGRACGHQEDFGPKRRGDGANNGKVAKIISDSRETN